MNNINRAYQIITNGGDGYIGRSGEDGKDGKDAVRNEATAEEISRQSTWQPGCDMPFVYINGQYSVQAAHTNIYFVNRGESGSSGEPGEIGGDPGDPGIVDIDHQVLVVAGRGQQGANGRDGEPGKGGKDFYWTKYVNTHKYDHCRGRWVNNALPLEAPVYSDWNHPATYAPNGRLIVKKAPISNQLPLIV